jgi:hypothetical protein
LLVATRLIAAIEHERKGKRGPEHYHLFTGFVTDGLALRTITLIHAPKALPAVNRALKRAREK